MNNKDICPYYFQLQKWTIDLLKYLKSIYSILLIISYIISAILIIHVLMPYNNMLEVYMYDKNWKYKILSIVIIFSN